jgi:hypothetical protein
VRHALCPPQVLARPVTRADTEILVAAVQNHCRPDQRVPSSGGAQLFLEARPLLTLKEYVTRM